MYRIAPLQFSRILHSAVTFPRRILEQIQANWLFGHTTRCRVFCAPVFDGEGQGRVNLGACMEFREPSSGHRFITTAEEARVI